MIFPEEASNITRIHPSCKFVMNIVQFPEFQLVERDDNFSQEIEIRSLLVKNLERSLLNLACDRVILAAL